MRVFHNWGYPKWMVYNGKIPSKNGWFGGTPILGNHHNSQETIDRKHWRLGRPQENWSRCFSNYSTVSIKAMVNIQKAIENGHRNSEFFPWQIVIFHSYVSLPEGKAMEDMLHVCCRNRDLLWKLFPSTPDTCTSKIAVSSRKQP